MIRTTAVGHPANDGHSVREKTAPDGILAIFTDLTSSWVAGGRRAPVAPAPQSSSNGCCIPQCSAMTFVELKTQDGRRSLCFKHFKTIQAQLAPSTL